mgnify:CR=1 FL=1
MTLSPQEVPSQLWSLLARGERLPGNEESRLHNPLPESIRMIGHTYAQLSLRVIQLLRKTCTVHTENLVIENLWALAILLEMGSLLALGSLNSNPRVSVRHTLPLCSPTRLQTWWLISRREALCQEFSHHALTKWACPALSAGRCLDRKC